MSFSRVLTQQEASCYWINYPDATKSITALGKPLTTEAASFSWNYMANRGELRDVTCESVMTLSGKW